MGLCFYEAKLIRVLLTNVQVQVYDVIRLRSQVVEEVVCVEVGEL